jgi:hypothetical protein
MKYPIYLIVSLLLLPACVDNNNDANVFDSQVQTVDKAKEVEDQILEAAEAQRRAIEAGTE